MTADLQVWVVILASKHSLLREIDSIHVSEDSALLAQDELYSELPSTIEVVIETHQLEDLESGY